jgi:hypothetical protein
VQELRLAMVELRCGKDLGALRIRTEEGLNITAFLDHLEACERCRPDQGELIAELNEAIGGEEED